jgi:DNA-directed RNA polymerase subunit RPC12/RpoP
VRKPKELRPTSALEIQRIEAAKDEPEHTDCIASGYEFHCPKCGDLNKLYEYRESAFCTYCGSKVLLDDPHHAMG